MCYNHKKYLFKLEMVIYAKEILIQNQMNYMYDTVVTAINLVIIREFVK